MKCSMNVEKFNLAKNTNIWSVLLGLRVEILFLADHYEVGISLLALRGCVNSLWL